MAWSYACAAKTTQQIQTYQLTWHVVEGRLHKVVWAHKVEGRLALAPELRHARGTEQELLAMQADR